MPYTKDGKARNLQRKWLRRRLAASEAMQERGFPKWVIEYIRETYTIGSGAVVMEKIVDAHDGGARFVFEVCASPNDNPMELFHRVFG